MSDKNTDFVAELNAKHQELTQQLTAKKSELFAMDSDQRRLAALLDAEKHSHANPKNHKGKGNAPSKDTRSDIQKNELKFKDQAKKLEELRKVVKHLEDDLKGVNHDLQVVNGH